MTPEYRIATLWIGGDLSYLEQLCLKSFVDAGHHITLYSYEPIGNVPEGVEKADAATILPLDDVVRHTRTGSPAPQADRFRYHMLSQCERTIWADTDAYCVRPFRPDGPHFFAWETDEGVNNGVLGLPRDSETLGELLAFTADRFAIPEWFDDETRRDLEEKKAAGTPVHAGDMPWGVWGPHALTHFLKKTGEIRFAMPRVTLYPFEYHERILMLRPGFPLSERVTDETLSIHFYGRRMRARVVDKFGGVPRPRSPVGQLLKKHGIDPLAAPIPLKPGASGADDEGDDE